MKKRLLFLPVAMMLLSFAACDDDNKTSGKWPEQISDPQDDYAEYVLSEVLQQETGNEGGVDIYSKFDFFKDVKLTLWLTDGVAHSLDFSEGDMPFFSHSYEFPRGKQDCVLDTSVTPNELRLKETDQLVGLIENGRLVMNFHVDSKLLNYKYMFKTTETKF